MKKIHLTVLLILGLALINLLQAQKTNEEQVAAKDTLWYLNGDYELISDYEFIEEGRFLNYKNEKGKHRDTETFFLFSLNKSDGTKNILYKPTMEEEGDTLTVAEMEAFVRGGALANKNYKARGALAEGFAVGVASPFLVASLGANPFFSIIIPAVNVSVVGVLNPSDKKIRENHPELSKDAMFVEGYKQSAKRKRTKKSIVGGLAGIFVGITTVFIIIATK